MPIYTYKCVNCGNIQEIFFLTHREVEVPYCRNCKIPMKKVFRGQVGLVFKGSGFYITDYVKKEKSHKEAEEKE